MPKSKGAKCAKSAVRYKGRKVKTKTGKTYRIAGLTSPRGEKWVHIWTKAEEAYVRYSDFRANGKAMDHLADAGLVIILSGDTKLIREEVAKLRQFPVQPLIERSGWTARHFAFPDGQVYSPRGADTPVVLFPPEPLKCAKAGTPKGWKQGVAEPLAGQTLATFMLITMFAATLLELTTRVGNFGYELVGEGGLGKSTLQQLMSSVAGGALPSAPGHYWINCNATANALEHEMKIHADLPIVMEEAALYAARGHGSSRGSDFQELVFRMSVGSSKGRFNAPRQTEHRFIYIMSSNQALAEVLTGGKAAVIDAAADRLITLPLDDRPHGIFDFLPDGRTGGSFAEELKAAAESNYGLALPQFVKCLFLARGEDEAALRAWLEKRLSKFRDVVGADPNNGSEQRVVDAFGLSYAAGKLAQRYKILPATLDCLEACKACYNLHRTAVRPMPDLPERLTLLAKRPGVIDLDTGLPKLTDGELRKIPAFIRTTRTGRREILFTEAFRDRFLPNFREIRREAIAAGLFKPETRRSTVRRRVRQGKKKNEALYRFFLPDNE